jgi:hypothetical protein
MTILRGPILVLMAVLAPGAWGTPAGDATTGALFGYRIATPYPLTGATEVVARSAPPARLITIVADRPVKPDDIDRVLLIVTPVSHTILTIGVQMPFDDEPAARAFAGKYLRLFSAKYPGAEADLEVIGRRGRIRFSDDYELVMTLLSRDEGSGDSPWTVEFLYQARPDSITAQSLSDLLAAEIDKATLKGQDTRGL